MKTELCLTMALFATIAEARIFDVTDYGAVGDRAVKCTEAFAKAVAACADAGGGLVSVPAGTYFTGPIHLRSNVELHLREGSKLYFSDDPKDCLPSVMSSWEGLECMNYSPLVYAYGCTNVAITGKGTIRAKMDFWAECMKEKNTRIQEARAILYKWGAEDYPVEKRVMPEAHTAVMRPQLIQFNRCSGVRLEGVRIEDSPFWTIHFLLCKGVTIRGIDVCAHGFNNDGIDLEMTQDVLIENSTFDQGDDCFVFKAGRNRDAWRLNTPTANVEIRNCHVKKAASLVGVGSEISGGIENIYVHDCTVDTVARLYYIKTNHRRGGFVRNVRLENVETDTVLKVAALETDVLYQWAAFPDYEIRPTEIDGMYLKNFRCKAARIGIDFRGDPRLPARNLVLENVHVGRTQEFFSHVENVVGVSLTDVSGGGMGPVRMVWDAPMDPFEDGERVVFLGDSITHHSYWINALTDFYLTRFPDRKIMFRNAGLSGDTAEGALRRLDEDVVPWNPTTVTVLFGMNDAGGGEKGRAKEFEVNLKKLGADLKRFCPDSKRIWLGATPYDETVAGLRLGKAAGVAACACKAAELAKAFGDPFVDLNVPFTSINLRHQRTDPKFTLCGADGIHPREEGALVILNELCQAQGLLREGPSVVLDATSGVRTFTVREKSLPYPVEPAAKAIADELGFVSAYASEIVQVKGLPEGLWTLAIDGEKVVEASAAEFAVGVELGKIETPMMKQAREVAAANHEIRELERNRQYCSAVRQTILKPKLGAAADNFAAVRKFIAEKRDDPEIKALYFSKYFDLYLKDWPRREELAAEIFRRETELDRIRQPVSRTWCITEGDK